MTADAPKPPSRRGGKREPKPGNHIGRPSLGGAGAGTSRIVAVRVDPDRDQKLARLQDRFGARSISATILRLIDDAPDD